MLTDTQQAVLKASQLPCGIMFHHFHNVHHLPSQGSIDAQQLEAILRDIGPKNFLSPQDWLTYQAQNLLKPEHYCISFDDALRCQFDVALPVLNRYNLKAFWFIYTAPLKGLPIRLELYRYFRSTCFETMEDFYHLFFEALQRYMPLYTIEQQMQAGRDSGYCSEYHFYTEPDRLFRYFRDHVLSEAQYHAVMEELLEQFGFSIQEPNAALWQKLWMDEACLKQLHQDGHMLGLHSHTHPTVMEQLPEAEQQQEFLENYTCLQAITGVAPLSMSHPSNSYNATTLRILQNLGIQVGFRADLVQDQYTALECPRLDHTYFIQAIEAKQALVTKP